ncbi:MAG: hypothetical protein RLZZ453_1128 [Chlamydiota bacterium]|jgi:hypothetical protein
MKRYLFLIFLALLSTSVSADFQEEPQNLIIQNRVLTQVNGKTISVMDLVKRMDLFLHKQYPELADSPVARYQFFNAQWKTYLRQMVDTELMLIDAERLEIKVADAEVREEILTRFGPNVMPTLDKAGLSYEEVREMIHDEMIVQRIQWFRVNSKALTQVNSQDVRLAYKKYLEKNPETDEWDYQVLSIRPSSSNPSADLLGFTSALIASSSSLQDLAEQLKKQENISVSLSDDMHANNQSLSSAHYQVLKSLKPGSYSQPIEQLSRSDGSLVYRVFYLKQHQVKKPLPFEKMAEELRNTLLSEVATKENTRYLLKLKQQLGYEDKYLLEGMAADFQPFALR